MAENERRRGRKNESRQTKQRKNAPEVVYTPAREFNRNRLVLNILTIFAVAFAIFLGLSIFFKVEQVTVSGNSKYSEWSVYEASGIQEGDSLWRWIDSLTHGTPMIIRDVEEIRLLSPLEYEFLKSNGVSTMVAVPF